MALGHVLKEQKLFLQEIIFTVTEEPKIAKFTIWQYKMRANAIFERTRAAMKEAFSLSVSIQLHADYCFKTYTSIAINYLNI